MDLKVATCLKNQLNSWILEGEMGSENDGYIVLYLYLYA